MTLYFKPGVNCSGTEPEIWEAILAAHDVYVMNGQFFTVTSLNDGQHMKNSLHYEGKGCDIRTRSLDRVTADEIAVQIRGRLGKDYDVVVEKDHIHLEYDPK